MDISHKKKNKKRILMVCSNNRNSGAFMSLLKLCEYIKASDNYEPVVIVGKGKLSKNCFEELGLRCYYIRMFSWSIKASQKDNLLYKVLSIAKRIYNIFPQMRIARIIDRENIDLVHINDIHTYVGAKAALHRSIPIIWHVRVLLELGQDCVLSRTKDYKLVDSSNTVIFPSKAALEHYSRVIKNASKKVIYNGIDPDLFFENKRTLFSDSTSRILHVGNMVSGKGQNYLIDAVKEIVEKGVTNIRITFVGGGPLLEQYKKRVTSYNLQEYVSFSGKQENVAVFYRNADVLVMSSDAESFGRVTIEAMLAGCLVMGSCSGATPELLQNGECGLLFEPKNSNDLASKLFKIIEMHDRQKYIEIARKGQQRAIECFSAKANADEIMQCYNNILE